MKPTLTPHQFVDTWANVYLKESSAYVTHFDDLCTLVGHPKPVHMDKTSPSLREGRRPTTHAPARTAGEQSPAENDIASQRPVREAGARMAKALAMTPLSQACALEDVIAQAAKELKELAESLQGPTGGAGCHLEEAHVDQPVQRKSHMAAKRPSQVG
jgi:hypothetical protein